MWREAFSKHFGLANKLYKIQLYYGFWFDVAVAPTTCTFSVGAAKKQWIVQTIH